MSNALTDLEGKQKGFQHLRLALHEAGQRMSFKLDFEFSQAANERGFLSKDTDLILYTAGLHEVNLPELVIYLGPRDGDRPYDPDDAAWHAGDLADKLCNVDLWHLSSADYLLKSGKPHRMRVWRSAGLNSASLVDLQEKYQIKTKYLPALVKHHGNLEFDIQVYKPYHWYS